MTIRPPVHLGIQEDGRKRGLLGIQGLDCWEGVQEECQGRLESFFL